MAGAGRAPLHVRALEHDDIYPAEMVEQMKALGLFGATIGTAYGGLGLSATTYARIFEKVSESGCRSPASSTRT